MAIAPTDVAAPPPVPPGWRLRGDRDLRVLEGGSVLLGGVPLRLFRLGPAAGRHVASWLAGEPVADRPRARALARRLLDAGLVHPVTAAPPPGTVTVVVPVHDRAAALARCLAALGRRHPVVVVDDASADAAGIAAAAAAGGAGLVRREVNGGPGAARNTGLAAVETPFVAFLDSDCVPDPGWVDRLLPHLGDPAVAVVAPRIVGVGAPPRCGLGAYEHARSPLDMGEREASVRPLSPVPYVPATAVLARVEALGNGFDPTLRVGEDVDLAWRLTAAGWTVRYDPGVAVAHAHRLALRDWLRTRIAYNEATAALALRHPAVLHAAYASRFGAAAWAAVALRRPGLAACSLGVGAALLRRRLAHSVERPTGLAAGIVARGALRDGASLARALRGAWLPPLAVAATFSGSARRLAVHAFVTAPLLEWATRRPPLDPVTAVAWGGLDDAARGFGVWLGCLRRGSLAPLLPGVGVVPRGVLAGRHAHSLDGPSGRSYCRAAAGRRDAPADPSVHDRKVTQ